MDLSRQRQQMVEQQIAGRGVRQAAVLNAMRKVPREAFVPGPMREHAYEDAPLPIDNEQTISQPYVVALMAEALELAPSERVLEVGTGSGYAAAVLAEIAAEVYTIERHANLAAAARARLMRHGYTNVHVTHGDGTRGWPEHAPYDAIVVAAGGPEVPQSLCEQLAPGGRLVIPVGPTPRMQELVRITLQHDGSFRVEHLRSVRFVPLVGEEGWSDAWLRPTARPRRDLPAQIRAVAEPFSSIEGADLSGLLARMSGARVVLIGEPTRGTSEFYRMRARITRELVVRAGFNLVAVEADHGAAAAVDRYARAIGQSGWIPDASFPAWTWQSRELSAFVEWLRAHNAELPPERRVGVRGLDLLDTRAAMEQVIDHLDAVAPAHGEIARRRYAQLTPWQGDAARQGRARLPGRYRAHEEEVVSRLLRSMDLAGRASLPGPASGDGLVAGAARYYRLLFYGAREVLALRDAHMFDALLALAGPDAGHARVVVWAHSAHVSDARATSLFARGHRSLGQRCREVFGPAAYLVGLGMNTGAVAAARSWRGPVEIVPVPPAHEHSYERLCHDAGLGAFLLPLGACDRLDDALGVQRLERAIDAVYRPRSELEDHYFEAVLPRQLDEYIWFDRTGAVAPLAPGPRRGVADAAATIA